MAPPERKLRTLRVLERAVDLAVQAAKSSTSSKQAGKLATELARDVQLLNELATGADDARFYKAVETAIVKLVKLTRKLLR